MAARLNYVELPIGDAGASATFFEQAFGWSLTAFGPEYSATTTGDVDMGLNGGEMGRPSAPLAIIQVDDLEACEAAVRASGGTVTAPIFAFPGGRRFHFREPGGCELAAMVPDPR